MFRLWKGLRSTVQTDRGTTGLLPGLPPKAQAAPVLILIIHFY